MSSLRKAPILGLVLLALLALSCGRPKAPWNVLLVTFDTTRADRLGCYGNERIKTPTLDNLAAQGVRFARDMTAVPITAPSHSSILTGRYPIAHGVRDNGLFVLGDEQVTLAEMLHDHGYATAAAVGSYPVTAQFGLDQGFDFFDDHLTGGFEDYLGERAVPKDGLFFDERRAAQVNEAVLPWIDAHAGAPFFVWVHYFDPHQPFEPPAPYDQLYADDLYNGEIAYADSRLGFLLDHLDELGVLDHTLVVMTGDHGEGRGEHNELTHAVLAYDSTLHVPLILQAPADAGPSGELPRGKVVDQRVASVDIVPTVLDLLGFEHPDGLQGRSLVPLWEGNAGEDPIRVQYAENLSPSLTHGWGELRVLFEGPLKLIWGPRPELYDIDADPGELHNLIAERPDDAQRLHDDLQRFLDHNAVVGVSKTEDVDDDVRKRLEALGYLHSGGEGGRTVSEVLSQDGIPPQDRVGDINNLSAAKHLLFAGKAPEAIVYTRKLVDADPDSPLYLELHAEALGDLGHLDEAWKVVEKLRHEGPVTEALMLQISARNFERGEQQVSVDALRDYLSTTPSAQGEWLLASFYEHMGVPEQSSVALARALEIDPGFVPARDSLAVHYAEAGDAAAAEREFLRALENAPYYAKLYYNYGTFLFQAGRYNEATPYFQRAVALTPGYLKARLALVVALLAVDRRAEAEGAYEELRRMAPASPEASQAEGILDTAPAASGAR